MNAPREFSVAAAVIARDGRILAAQRPAHKLHPGAWEFPGGKIAPGETPEACLVRELREELDVDIEVGPCLHCCDHDYPGEGVRVRLWFFAARIVAGEPAPREHAQLRWLAAQDLPSLPFLEADHAVVAALARGELRPQPHF